MYSFRSSPPFELAYLYRPGMEINFPVFVEPKLDGIRVFVVVDKDGEVSVWTRNRKRLEGLEELYQECRLPKNTVLDGELYYNDWNTTVAYINSGENLEKLRLWVFDIFPLDQLRRSTLPLWKRKQKLSTLRGKCRYIKVMPSIRCSEWRCVVNVYKRLLKRGFEGAMIKDIHSEYQFGKRTSDWLKLKERDFLTFKCVGAEEGKGKNKGKLGALILRSKGGDTFKVGTGFSEEDRVKFWRDPPIGKCIEIEITKSKEKEAKVIFPVFHRVRWDIKC